MGQREVGTKIANWDLDEINAEAEAEAESSTPVSSDSLVVALWLMLTTTISARVVPIY